MKNEIDYNHTDIDYYLKQAEELRNQFRIKSYFSGKQRFKVINSGTKNPKWPDNPKEAFELLKDYHAKHWLLAGEIVTFLSDLGSWDIEAMEQELAKINQFISETNKIDIRKTNKNQVHSINLREHQQITYVKIVHHYYNTHNVRYDEYYVKAVYGRYFLFKELLEEKLKSEIFALPQLKHLLNIPTKADSDDILNFWLKLTNNNEKGEPYWENEKEIVHFVNQNFKGSEGVTEIKKFDTNMNKTEFYQVTQSFMDKYKITNSKDQYTRMLLENFTIFKDDKFENVKSNIANKGKKLLHDLFK